MSSIKTWQIGGVRVTRIAEGPDFAIDPSLLFPIDRQSALEHAWLRPRFVTTSGELLMTIQAFVLETEDRRIVVDTCIGNDKRRHAPMWNNLQGPFLHDLAAAGYPPECIDTVICTHLHVDHVGWNTRWVEDRWIPTFPNARYLFARLEWEHWCAEVERKNNIVAAAATEAANMMQTDELIEDSIRPIMDAGLHEFVETNHRLTAEVALEPAPGHTPGHVSVRIDSRGSRAVLTGDLMHHPLQCARPELGTHIDWDNDRGHRTRIDFFNELADKPVFVLGSHFVAPTGGYIRTHGKTWRFAVDPPASPPSPRSP